MKKLFLILFITVSMFPLVNSKASSSDFTKFSDRVELKSELIDITGFSIKKFKTEDGIKLSPEIFINNKEEENVHFTLNIYFYDSAYNLVDSRELSGDLDLGSNMYLPFDLLKDLNVSGISYYKIETTEFINPIDKSDSLTNENKTTIPSKNENYSHLDFVIDNYDIKIKVNKNKILDITETIDIYYNSNEGLFRKTIPLKPALKRLDGTKSYNLARVNNISVNKDFKKNLWNGRVEIDLKPKAENYKKHQIYVIKYTYEMGKDKEKGYDELYYELLHNRDVIGKLTFEIDMPKEFDRSKISFLSKSDFYKDYSMPIVNNNISYSVIGNKIIGKSKVNLSSDASSKNSILFRLELDDGYFESNFLSYSIENYITGIISIIFLLLSIYLWYKYGNDEEHIETVEFYPPNNLNSLEAGFLYNGKADVKDVMSLLIYLENKGYLKIIFSDEDKKSFKVKRLKAYDGDNIYEKKFFSGLFSHANKNSEISSKKIKETFHITIGAILNSINYTKNDYFESNKLNKKILVIAIIVLTYLINILPPILTYESSEDIHIYLFYPVVLVLLYKFIISKSKVVYIGKYLISKSVIYILLQSVLGAIFWLGSLFFLLGKDSIYFTNFAVGMFCIFGMVLCMEHLPKRTKYGNELYGKLVGFKNFLETTQKDKLNELLNDNPSYFKEIIPFAYVLNISNKWIKQFADIIDLESETYAELITDDISSFSSEMNEKTS